MSHRLVKTCLLINKTWCVRYMTQNMCNFVFEIEEVKELAGGGGSLAEQEQSRGERTEQPLGPHCDPAQAWL